MIRSKLFGEEHIQTATTINNIALAYDAQGRFDEALEMYLKSHDIFEKLFGGSNHTHRKFEMIVGCIRRHTTPSRHF